MNRVYHKLVPCGLTWNQFVEHGFDELLLTWNTPRPLMGSLSVFIRLKTHVWSEWFLYAMWGTASQKSFTYHCEKTGVNINHDVVEIIGCLASAFEVRIAASEGVCVPDGVWLHVAVANRSKRSSRENLRGLWTTVSLPINGLSQFALNHPHSPRLCSPTSTSAVIQFLKPTLSTDVSSFAAQVWDEGGDIYGNWVFNCAQAYAELGKGWHCWVMRLNGFEEIIVRLCAGIPVVISLRGPLSCAASDYLQGHLVVVCGYNAETEEVECRDPAFTTNDLTHVKYPLKDFLEAWNRRQNIAYVFEISVES